LVGYIFIVIFVIISLVLGGWELIYNSGKDEVLSDMISIKRLTFNFSKRNFQSSYNEMKNKYSSLENDNYKLKMELYRVENSKVGLESNTNAIAFVALVLFITIIVTGASDITNFLKDIIINPNSSSKLKEYLNLDDILFVKELFILAYIVITGELIFGFVRDSTIIKIYDLAIKVLNDIKKETNEKEDTVKIKNKVTTGYR
jgi:hypothetical protein